MISSRRGPVVIMLGLVLAFSMLIVACGDDDDDDDTGTSETPTQQPSGEETASATSEGTETGPTEEIGTIDVMGVWGGGGEQESFEAVVAPWEQETGGKMNYTGTRDLTQQLTVRVEGGDPPDVAIPPEVGLMQQFAQEGEIQPLSQCEGLEDMVRQNYGDAFIDLGSVDGELYGIVFKVDSKGTIFYNPQFFADNGLEPLTADSTWDDLMTLAGQVKDTAGVPPFSMGLESAESTGWVATDWIQQILLAEAGIDTYNGVASGEVPFTDPAVKDAWEKFGQVVHGDGMVLQDVPAGVLSTTFQASTYPPFASPPEAGMVYLGAFGLGFITEQYPDIVPGEGVDVMPFPGGAVTGGFNVAYMFEANPTACSFMEHLASADAQQVWVEAGGFTSANKEVDLNAYPDEVARKVAEQVVGAEAFAPDLDDLVGGQWQQAFFQAAVAYIQDAGQLDSLLANVDASRSTSQ